MSQAQSVSVTDATPEKGLIGFIRRRTTIMLEKKRAKQAQKDALDTTNTELGEEDSGEEDKSFIEKPDPPAVIPTPPPMRLLDTPKKNSSTRTPLMVRPSIESGVSQSPVVLAPEEVKKRRKYQENLRKQQERSGKAAAGAGQVGNDDSFPQVPKLEPVVDQPKPLEGGGGSLRKTPMIPRKPNTESPNVPRKGTDSPSVSRKPLSESPSVIPTAVTSKKGKEEAPPPAAAAPVSDEFQDAVGVLPPPVIKTSLIPASAIANKKRASVLMSESPMGGERSTGSHIGYDASAHFGRCEERWDFVLQYPFQEGAASATVNSERDNVVVSLRGAGLVCKKVKSKNKVYLNVGCVGDTLKKYAQQMQLPVRRSGALLREPYKMKNESLYAKSELLELSKLAAPLSTDSDEAQRYMDGTNFSSSDRQRIVWFVMTHVCHLDLHGLVQRGVLKRVVAMHDAWECGALMENWVKRKPSKKQPIDLVYEYFGSQVAFFFAFAAFYTNWLIPLALLGLITFGLSFFGVWEGVQWNVVYAILSMLWAVLFALHWKRKANTLRFNWGLLGPDEGAPAASRAPDLDEHLPSYKGESKRGFWFGDSFVPTSEGPFTLHESKRWHRFRMWISYSIVAFAVVVIAVVALTALAVQVKLNRVSNVAGSLLFIVVVTLSEAFNTWLARRLTAFENHRVMSSFEQHVAFKIFLFFFVSNSAASYFVAFLKEHPFFCPDGGCCVGASCEEELQKLVLQLIVSKAISNLLGTYLKPLLLGLFLRGKESIPAQAATNTSGSTIKASIEAAKKMKNWQVQVHKPPFEGTLLLYHHLIAQLSSLLLFSSAIPLGPLIALVTNAIWLRNQGSALLKFTMRPRFAEARRGPIQWVAAMQVLVFLSIATNIGLALFTFNLQVRTSLFDRLQLAFLIEHACLLFWLFVSLYIPAMPGRVKKMLAQAMLDVEKIEKKQA